MKYLKSLSRGLKRLYVRIKNFLLVGRSRVLRYIDRKPFKSFFIALGILFILIVISNILGKPKVETKKPVVVAKEVKIYTIGSAPKISVQAQVEKSGVIRITALTPGVVQFISKDLGYQVYKGEVLVGLSSNYQGGNTFSLQRQLAETQYQNTVSTADLQKEIIKKQREIAEKGNTNADELRNITDQSVTETSNLITLNDEILTSLDKNLANLVSTNVGGANDALILSTKQLKAQFLAANNQARQALRLGQLNASSDKPPAEISNLQKDLAFKQLDLQEKMLDLGREVSRIQLQIARVGEAMMFPAAPFNGTVQRVSVKIGQAVNPGQELMVLSGEIGSDPVVAIAYVSHEIADKISRLEASVIHINDKISFEAHPSYVTVDAIAGSLYGIYFPIPDQYARDLTEKGFIQIDIPIGYYDTSAAIPYIPIDAIYQTEDQNYVFVVKDGKAEARSVGLGQVFGSFVEITRGLSGKDRVIVNRNVIAGDTITVTK
ncbi:hypothetical protein HY407_00680 [Candidatus Gottesmanbacteria bacterium]|nr:hypothetical protein [Candidatus Gottesmanbacteria bacterium]